ncbi:unnamed protein product [Symbiodinium sp. CCMP2592]|nr:unnamed protein product [Symbiodinium sp. CCMP2592]
MRPFRYQTLAEDVEALDDPGVPTCQSRTRRLLSCLALLQLTIMAVFAVRASAGGPVHALREIGVGDIMRKFSIFQFSMAMYENEFGDTDPFQFRCPVPGTIAGGSDNMTCCRTYNNKGWPFQFRECETFGFCTTCWVETEKPSMQRHPAIEFVGASWAATISVKNKAEAKSGWLGQNLQNAFGNLGVLSKDKVDDAPVRGSSMRVRISRGIMKGETDSCPGIDDWHIDMLNEDKENIHARVFKSPRTKLAIVAFRGTQFKSMKNWEVDADIQRIPLKLPNGNVTYVHEGFLKALELILPHVKRWVDGYIFGLFQAVPSDWKLIFTGHSLGGALALLAATKSFADRWPRTPEAVVVFGVPRFADAALDHWWRQNKLCQHLVRVNTYNDMVHVMPFQRMWSALNVATSAYDCFTRPVNCIRQSTKHMQHALAHHSDGLGLIISDQWSHVCPESEILVPSRVKGVNEQLEELSLFGGVLSHLNENCLYGYIYGVLHSNISTFDKYCRVSPSICTNLTHLGP